MSKINELIEKLCSKGVKYYLVGDICETVTDYVAAGSFADIARNVTYLDSPNYAQLIRTTDIKSKFKNGKFIYVDENAFNYLWRVNLNQESIILPNIGNCGEVYFIKPEDLPYENNVLATNAILVRSNVVNNKYLSYVFQDENFQVQLKKITSPAGQTKFNKTDLKRLKVPIPPKEVQEEIVKILDKFNELEADLEIELEARKQQYDYWRGKLIKDLKSDKYKLNEIAKVYDGTHTTPNYKENGIPFISVENINDIYSSNKYISKEDYDKYKIKPQINDVFMTRIGSIGKCAVFEKNMDLAYYVSLALIRPDNKVINSRYLKYYLESFIGQEELRMKTLVHAVPIKINKDDIGKINIIVPSLKEQQKIVNILDKFEKIVNDRTNGLPAEIELRKKQYEYYRNRLLNFKEVSINE